MKTKRNICYHGKTHWQLYTVHAFGLVLSLQDGRLSASNISRAMTIDNLRFLVEQDLKEIESKHISNIPFITTPSPEYGKTLSVFR